MSRSLWAGLLLWALSASALPAQDAFLEEVYGRGVHAYFAGRYREAYDSLTTAISAGSTDPRAYYFRGLVYANLGRPEDAAEDFTIGARLEAAGGGTIYPVGQSLA